ncbi:Glycoside hydrolase family 59 [Streptantibioticus cattleyicolor NRRL 8057 = DSM 46488]|uniref:galactosylceramidase n=1 Tax=Streptantibioticus cattleyicolor (strain ATCC 35852 / DSM 46488 / JCM 4925 / NBRC 14057 / NRRL 8057) TaxID=1003195 RepID=G8X446_STREN|nr:Glycoside hydrolase family 59 [Streptantibioticus cattleyicolor NRRL 8057 = DSM 46488]
MALLLVAAAPLVAKPTAARAAIPTAITVDGDADGRVFDGVGAISGGGGNSRLLADYPEPQRSRILDYLFKPGYGAALQILKVEIGGDTNSTDGAEPSHEHTRGAVDCDRGYEWWLMAQAKARNPGIKLYGLAWGAPGWIGGGHFWSQDMIDYLVSWLGCAKSHGLTVDYLGGWNERGYDKAWYEKLHATMAADGYPTKVVGADSDWGVADAMAADPAFAGSVDVVGAHYPCGYMSAMTSCSTTPAALASGKPLWASENGSEDFDTGGAPIARALNRGYLDAKFTAFINWPLVAAVYQNLPYNTMGLVTASQPWSGAYRVGRSTWAVAHTTQFTRPGWSYVDPAGGYLGGSRANGSYVTYRSPDRRAWSTVLETLDATAAQPVTFKVTGGLPGGTLHVWSSDLSSPSQRDYLVHSADLTPGGGVYALTLQPGHVYTVTTTTGQGAGTAVSPARSRLALPYRDSFDTTPVGGEARYLADMNGSFEAVPCGGGRHGTCVRQMAPTAPIAWDSPSDPYATAGDLSWSDYTVSVDTMLEQAGSAELLGRVGLQHGFDPADIDAYRLVLGADGGWSLLRGSASGTVTTLANGSVKAPGTGTWHTLALTFAGGSVTAAVDGVRLASVTDTAYGSGQVGIGTSGYVGAQFDNLGVTPGAAADLSGTYRLVSRNSGQVLDAKGAGTADGTPVIQWPDNGGANQEWRLTATGDGYYTLTGVGSGKALDVPDHTTVAGTQLDLRTPDGTTAQQWLVVPARDGYYTVESRDTAELADVDGAATTQGASVIQWPADGGTNQQWQLVKVS